MKVNGLNHVALRCTDLDRTRKFFAETLGLEEITRPAFNFPGAWFAAGRQEIHLIVGVPDTRRQGAGGDHFSLEIDDMDEAVARMKARKAKIVGGPGKRPDGALQLYVESPDGHIVELTMMPG